MDQNTDSYIGAIGIYAPPWIRGRQRVAGPDEDALTMAVAAARAADPGATASRVVLVSRSFPLLEGGNGAVLLAGLSLSEDVPVSEVLGGGPAVLDQLLGAAPGTLVVAADSDDEHRAAAALISDHGTLLTCVGRVTRSLPVTARGANGVRHFYGDPRLQREIGAKASLGSIELDGSVIAAAGLTAKDIDAATVHPGAVFEKHGSASAVIAALGRVIDAGIEGLLVTAEQATVSAARVSPGLTEVRRDEAEPEALPTFVYAEGVGIPISLAAYSRAFEPKLRWEGAVFASAPGIDDAPVFPPRLRTDDNGVLVADYQLRPLPRTGTVYTHTTIRIPVPDLPSPYTIAVIQLDDSPVRVLLKVTGVAAGSTQVGQSGAVVLRKIADRAGIPDYGYAFRPDRVEQGVSA